MILYAISKSVTKNPNKRKYARTQTMLIPKTELINTPINIITKVFLTARHRQIRTKLVRESP